MCTKAYLCKKKISVEQNKIFSIKTEQDFNKAAIEVFQYQSRLVKPYREYLEYLRVKPNQINHYNQIPFLPIQFFKSHPVIADKQLPEITFTSSGTTGTAVSRHQVSDLTLYERSFFEGFQQFYGNIDDYCVLALLPSYLERQGSSLVYMADRLIAASSHPDSGFYLNNYGELRQKLEQLQQKNQKTLLIGVTYALLDLAEQYPMPLKNTVVMETGGMKGRRKEMVRQELHQILGSAFHLKTIHSEYGMTELLSQAYSLGDGVFNTPPWMRVMIRDTYDPFSYMPHSRTGGINVVDLANMHSCSFIETMDLGKAFNDGAFTIVGRFDNSDIRGCNLMVE